MQEPTHSWRWAIIAVSAAVIVAAGLELLEFHPTTASSSPSPIGAQSTTSTTLTSTYINASSGLSLRLGINSTTLAAGQNLSVSISEYNSQGTPENISVAARWPMANLTTNPCGLDYLPFGVAVLKGNYDQANLSSAATIQVFEPGPRPGCSGPGGSGNFNDYYFEPHSFKAALSGDLSPDCTGNCAKPLYISQTILIMGYWTWEPQLQVPVALHPLQPGEYTLVGGDEWGTIAILHFTVNA